VWVAGGECILRYLAMPRLCSFSRLSLIALLLAAFGSVAWAKPKIAILGLEASNSGVVDPKDAANAARLTEELRTIPRGGVGKFDFAPNSNRELQDEKLMGNCDTEKPACMAPIGGGLGADYLIYGSIVKGTEKGKDGYKARLSLLNVKTKIVEEQSDTFVPMGTFSGGSGPKEWAQKVYAKLSGEKSPVTADRVEPAGPGKLIVSGNVKSGDVFIDASKKGRLDDGKLTLTLADGSHELAIEAPGHKRYEATVTVKSGQTRTVDAVLEEIVGPVTPPVGKKSNRLPLKVAGYSLAAVGVASGAYVLITSVSGPIPDYEDLMMQPMDADGKEVSTSSSDCGRKDLRSGSNPANKAFDKACDANRKRFIVGGIGIATSVLAIGALYFAYRSDGQASEKQSAIGKRSRRQLIVTPVISPSGGGATVRFDW
jgi:hypothetical protein